MNLNYLAVIFTGLMLGCFQTIATETAKKHINSQKVIMTAKEKLGKKASDNQRVNKCKVPVEMRGTKPRSDKCTRQF